MSCNFSDSCKKYQANIGNPYQEQSPCNFCKDNMNDYDRGFQKGYRVFAERLNDFLDTHGTNETLIKKQINDILIELEEEQYH